MGGLTQTLQRKVGRLELLVLLVSGAIAGGLWAFIEVADAVLEGDTRAIDRALLLAMRGPDGPSDPFGPLWLEQMARDYTALGSLGVLSLLTAGIFCYLLLIRRTRIAAFVLGTVGGGLLLSTLLKHTFDRARPTVVPYDLHVTSPSFPSGHTMMAAVTYLTLSALLAHLHERRSVKVFILSIALLLTVAVGATRVYLGVHWPSDVLAGWTAGAVWALCWLGGLWLWRQSPFKRRSGKT